MKGNVLALESWEDMKKTKKETKAEAEGREKRDDGDFIYELTPCVTQNERWARMGLRDVNGGSPSISGRGEGGRAALTAVEPRRQRWQVPLVPA